MYNIDDIRTINWEMIAPEAIGGELALDLISFMNKSARYLLGKWWAKRGFNKEVKADYLSLHGAFDKVTRQSIYAVKTLAFALTFCVYDEKVVGYPHYAVRDKYIKALRSCVYHHLSNDPSGWGDEEENITHVYELGLSAWITWDKLNAQDREYVVNMLEYVAKKLYDASPRFYYTESGMPVDRGVSTVYYNTAVANLMQLVATMMPKSPMIARYREIRDRFYIATYSFYGNSVHKGSNIYTDNVLCNYGVPSSFATSYIGSTAKSCIMSCLAGEEILPYIAEGYEQIYHAFYKTTQDDKGRLKGDFVTYDAKGRPMYKLKCSEGGAQARNIEGQAYLMDIVAFCSGVTGEGELSPRDWARVRIKKILQRMANGGGFCVQAPQFVRGTHGECVCSALTDAYILLFFYAVNKGSIVSNKDKYMDR